MMILDGGMGQELIARAGRATDMWSVQALMDSPDMVRAVHDDYFAAGAQVATTNTYALLPDRLDSKGMGAELASLTTVACDQAVRARDAHGSGLVAGALGPLGFSYQPDKAPPADQAAEIYARMAQMHLPFVDVHILETMSSVDQAKGGLMGASVTGKPVWVGLSVDDSDGTKLRSGEDVADVMPVLAQFQPEVVLINCSLPEAVSQAVPLVAGYDGLIGAYANGFTGIHKDFTSFRATVDLLDRRTDLGPQEYLAFAKSWVASGATVIGGCCEVGPDHIRALSAHFAA